MYLKRVHIQNIRSIADLTWEIDQDNAAGWHVILGDNGAGKSTFVRSIAIALIGPAEAFKLLENWGQWLPYTASEGTIAVDLLPDKQIDKIRKPDKEEEDRMQAMITTMQAMHPTVVRQLEGRTSDLINAQISIEKIKDIINYGRLLQWEIFHTILYGAKKPVGLARPMAPSVASPVEIQSTTTPLGQILNLPVVSPRSMKASP